MKPILIDSNAYIAVAKRDADALAVINQAPRIAISVVVLGELLGGFRSGSRNEENRSVLARFLNSHRVELLPIDEPIAERYAQIMAQLRAAGRPIPTNDVWIAATALEHGFAVHSYDTHLHVVPGLKVVAKLANLNGG